MLGFWAAATGWKEVALWWRSRAGGGPLLVDAAKSMRSKSFAFARRARGGYVGLPALRSKSIPSPVFLPHLAMEISSSSPAAAGSAAANG